jgi:hypothetical protein
MRTAIPLGSGAAALATLLVGTAAATSPVYVSVNAGGRALAVKPKGIHLVSNENLSGLRWSAWGGETAYATGTDHGNSPSAGHRASNPVRVQATDRRRCGSRRVYTTIRVHFTKGVPYAGQPHETKYSYGCPSYDTASAAQGGFARSDGKSRTARHPTTQPRRTCKQGVSGSSPLSGLAFQSGCRSWQERHGPLDGSAMEASGGAARGAGA